ALAEATGSLREFYHLVRAGVPFPHDPMGSYIGYKTDHDPFERATSAGPKTSRYMSECLEKQVRSYGIQIHDHMEVAEFLTIGEGQTRRIIGVVTLDKTKLSGKDYGISVYFCRNVVLAAGGPGELYETSVYPKGQCGIHGIAFRAGLAAENLTESQFGLASTTFRWNVSGSYCQAIPRIFSTDANGRDERDFLADFFPTMSKMATNIFLKGYQWPFDPQRIENLKSSLIDVLVFNETQKGLRIFMDFRENPRGNSSMKDFNINNLEPEAYEYLRKTGALQATPIERLAHLNPLAIEVYKEHGIDLNGEPVEIAVCAQHNNGGFVVDKWWQSNIRGTFVIGEMAGTHGVKRPGGSALNAGQVGGLRAAEYIVNAYDSVAGDYSDRQEEIEQQLGDFVGKLEKWGTPSGLIANDLSGRIQSRMTASAAHIRELNDARKALLEAVQDYTQIQQQGFELRDAKDIVTAIRAEYLALTGVAYLKAIVELLRKGSGSRGSHMVVSEHGTEIHPAIINKATGKPLRVKYDPQADDLFVCESTPVRPAPTGGKAFEPAWQDFRDGKIYKD
ncbi:MAG: oxidoreductase, partial [Planctomycetota bacterium]